MGDGGVGDGRGDGFIDITWTQIYSLSRSSTKSLSKLARVASGMEFLCASRRCGVRVRTRPVLDPSHAAKFARKCK